MKIKIITFNRIKIKNLHQIQKKNNNGKIMYDSVKNFKK